MDTNSYNADQTGIKIGDRVRWSSSAGTFRGEVVDMRIALNAAKELVPWITIQIMDMYAYKRVEICGSAFSLKMLNFRVNFRDRVAA
jgi:hypothetical protein